MLKFQYNYVTKTNDKDSMKFKSPAKRSSIHQPIYLFSPGIHTPYLAGIPPTPNTKTKISTSYKCINITLAASKEILKIDWKPQE